MSDTIEVLFTPADFGKLRERDISGATCVVFDILRATSTMITALAGGARNIFPVEDIAAAAALKRTMPGALLAGERHGLRITAAISGGVEFDLGNSPREFTPAIVTGRDIIMTTTNGTRALQACCRAGKVHPASFLNLGTLARHLMRAAPEKIIVVCSGTGEEAALEDTLAAGAFVDALARNIRKYELADSAFMAQEVYRANSHDLMAAMSFAQNGRRLFSLPDLAPDVAFCLQRDTTDLLAVMDRSGRVYQVTE